MSRWFAAAACVALAILGSYSVQTLDAQQPIREGARRTGEAVVEGGRAVAEGTRQVIRGTGEVAAGAARRTGDAARRLTGRETRYDAQGRPYYVETTDDATQFDDQGRPLASDEQSGELQNESNAERYESGYRGTEDQSAQHNMDSGQQVFHDRCGRAFICDNGRRLYLTEQNFAPEPAEHEARKPVAEDRPNLDDEQMEHDESESDEPTSALDGTSAPPPPPGATAPPTQQQ